MNRPDARYSQIVCERCGAGVGEACIKVRGPYAGQKADLPHMVRLKATHSFHTYVVFLPGPGNCWIETVEGNCPHCGCMAKLHTKTHRKPWPDSRSEEWSLPSSWDYGTKCTGCGCRVDIPHGKVESILGEGCVSL